MTDGLQQQHGGVVFPLTAATTNSLLRDADPTLYYLLDFVANVIHLDIGARLIAQAALEGYSWSNAVQYSTHIEPSQYLKADQFRFPLLAIYRQREANIEWTAAYEQDTAQLELAYVLPYLTPRQHQQLDPILRAVSRCVCLRLRQGSHPQYNSGQAVLAAAGLKRIGVESVAYGAFQPVQNIEHTYRAVTMKIVIEERDTAYLSQYDAMDGVDVQIDMQDPVTTTILADVVDDGTHPAPTVVSLSPSSGTKAGGTGVTITGTNFRVGTPVLVAFGGAYASNALVTSTTTITCTTPAHDAFGSFAADVIVTDDDGQTAKLSGGFTFT